MKKAIRKLLRKLNPSLKVKYRKINQYRTRRTRQLNSTTEELNRFFGDYSRSYTVDGVPEKYESIRETKWSKFAHYHRQIKYIESEDHWGTNYHTSVIIIVNDSHTITSNEQCFEEREMFDEFERDLDDCMNGQRRGMIEDMQKKKTEQIKNGVDGEEVSISSHLISGWGSKNTDVWVYIENPITDRYFNFLKTREKSA